MREIATSAHSVAEQDPPYFLDFVFHQIARGQGVAVLLAFVFTAFCCEANVCLYPYQQSFTFCRLSSPFLAVNKPFFFERSKFFIACF